MKQYKIIIRVDTGDEVQANVAARNKADAVRRLSQIEEFRSFVGNRNFEIVSIEAAEIKSIDNERFGITTIDNKPGWYVVADLDNKIKVEWKKGRYNDTQHAMPFGDKTHTPDAMQIATALREIGEYLYNNFKELL